MRRPLTWAGIRRGDPLAVGLQGWWPVRCDEDLLDEVSGTASTMSSAVGDAQRPTLAGYPLIGKVRKVRGNQGSYIRTNIIQTGSYAAGISMSAWILVTGISEELYIASDAAAGFDWVFRGQNGGDPFQFTLRGRFDSFSGASGVVADRPTHVAVTYDFANVRYYVDGVLISTDPQSYGPGSPDVQEIFLMSLNTTGSGAVNNEIAMADYALWNRPLSGSEIWRLFRAQTRWGLYARASDDGFDAAEAVVAPGGALPFRASIGGQYAWR